jgi:hypothetical protein
MQRYLTRLNFRVSQERVHFIGELVKVASARGDLNLVLKLAEHRSAIDYCF